jgi:hypothetical protein
MSAEPGLKLMPLIAPVNFLILAGIATAIFGVIHTVAVIVEIWTAVVILEPIFVLWLRGALVGRVGDAVSIIVEFRATVVVLKAISVLWLHRALVGRVGDAVAVVVGLRAAVVVLEGVLVFCLVGTLVGIADDAITVRVRGGRRRGLFFGLFATEFFVDRDQAFEVSGDFVLLGRRREQDTRVESQAPAVVHAVLDPDASVRVEIFVFEEDVGVVGLEQSSAAGASHHERQQLVRRVRSSQLQDHLSSGHPDPNIHDLLARLAGNHAAFGFNADQVPEHVAESKAEQDRVANGHGVRGVRRTKLVLVAEDVNTGGPADLDSGASYRREDRESARRDGSGDRTSEQAVHRRLDPFLNFAPHPHNADANV